MEQHAVPQDITGFKFKLVGDMTLKQFGELAGGALVAWLFYSTNWILIVKLPLAIFFGLLGVALAFFPIEERPLDIWILNFFRAIYRPTYYIWKRETSSLSVAASSVPSQITSFSQAPINPQPLVPTSPELKLWPFKPEPEKKTAPVVPDKTQTTVSSAISVEELAALREKKLKEKEMAEAPRPEEKIVKEQVFTIDGLVKKRDELTSQKEEKEANQLSESEAKINELINKNRDYLIQIEEIKNQMAGSGGADTTELKKRLDELTNQKNQTVAQMSAMRSQITKQRVEPITMASYTAGGEGKGPGASVKPTQRPVVVAPALSLTSLPNIINGLVMDQKGSPIDGAILVIRDQMGNSIRALKTNKVGQFMVNTPLPNGTYYLDLEKANYNFDSWEVSLTGEILRPLEIKAKATQEVSS